MELTHNEKRQGYKDYHLFLDKDNNLKILLLGEGYAYYTVIDIADIHKIIKKKTGNFP